MSYGVITHRRDAHEEGLVLQVAPPLRIAHDGKKQKIKDEDQKIILEGNGWQVVDFWYHEMPNLFDSNKTEKKEREAMWEVLKGVKGKV